MNALMASSGMLTQCKQTHLCPTVKTFLERKPLHLASTSHGLMPGGQFRSFQRRSQLISCAQRKDEVLTGSGPVTYLLDYAASLGITKDITQTQAYSVWLQGAVVLVILAAIDAAYSGDWSRMGVISKEVELGLRPLLGLLGLFHIFCGTIGAIAASRKGYNPVPATAKILAVGFLALVEVLLKDPAEGSRA